MKGKVSDFGSKKSEKWTMLRLFSPLTATRYPRYDWDDINGEEEELLPTELCNYQKEILDQIAKERLSEEGDRGLAEYLNDEGLKEKIYRSLAWRTVGRTGSRIQRGTFFKRN